jgi:hypothetical protein
MASKRWPERGTGRRSRPSPAPRFFPYGLCRRCGDVLLAELDLRASPRRRAAGSRSRGRLLGRACAPRLRPTDRSKGGHACAYVGAPRAHTRGAYQPELVLHYSENVGRADAKQQHTVRRLQSTHHPPMVFQNKPRRAAGADRINGVEDCFSQRVERAKPQICRRPNRCLDPMQRGQKKSDHADHRRNFEGPLPLAWIFPVAGYADGAGPSSPLASSNRRAGVAYAGT